jgi:predicted DNA-binding protein
MEKKTEKITVWLGVGYFERLESLAKVRRRRTNEFAREVIIEGFNVLNVFDRIGFVRLVIIIDSLIVEPFTKEKMQRNIDGKAMTFTFDSDLADKMDKLAKKGGISKSQLVKNLLEMGIEDIEKIDKEGLMTLVKLMEKVGSNLRERFSKTIKEGLEKEGLREIKE